MSHIKLCNDLLISLGVPLIRLSSFKHRVNTCQTVFFHSNTTVLNRKAFIGILRKFKAPRVILAEDNGHFRLTGAILWSISE